MRHRGPGPARQRGITFLGWVFLLIPVALVLYAAIRLTPVFLEYTKIARTLEQVSEEFKGEQVDARGIRTAVERRFDIESVTVIDRNDVKIDKSGNGFTLEAHYFDTVPFIANISLTTEFRKVVEVE